MESVSVTKPQEIEEVDFVICKICGYKTTALRSDHFKKHNLTTSEYKNKFNLKYTTCSKKRASCDTQSLAFFTKKFGEEKGLEEYKKGQEFHRYKNTKEGLKALKGWSDEKIDEYNRSRAVTLKNQIKKHGEEKGLENFNSYCKKQETVGISLDYFKEKYGDIIGTEKYASVNKQKALTLENFTRLYGEEEGLKRLAILKQQQSRPIKEKLITKYGVVEGEEKYKNWVKTHTNFGKISKVQKEFILEILEKINFEAKIYSYLTSEYFLMRDSKYFLYDLAIISDTKKIIVEFNGDFWHANPRKYCEDQILYFPEGGKIVSEIWEKDLLKQKIAEDAGFEFIVCWEYDWKHHKEDELTRIVAQICK